MIPVQNFNHLRHDQEIFLDYTSVLEQTIKFTNSTCLGMTHSVRHSNAGRVSEFIGCSWKGGTKQMFQFQVIISDPREPTLRTVYLKSISNMNKTVANSCGFQMYIITRLI